MSEELYEILKEKQGLDRNLYQNFNKKEQERRVAYHYEVDANFFKILTGGEWNVYSSPMGSSEFSLNDAQERKLDEFAKLMKLKPGMTILEVGCGWGGPLVYLCHKYHVKGVGITLSEKAIPVATQRAKDYGVDAQFFVKNWQDLDNDNKFDAIYTDEVIVHFSDLQGFFNKAKTILNPEGILVNKELHFKHSIHKHSMDNLSAHINRMYGYSGNYRTLLDELSMIDHAGFQLEKIIDIPIEDYRYAIENHWIKNINRNKKHLEELTSKRHVYDIKLYLKGINKIFLADVFGLHIVAVKPNF
ncbi:SAM-dependent methyltransferase [Marinicellulosiphila megalodicopiae]|uniref:SAM-dependent methyltransferase n=1 Tax=Marinicellulosiphila megalodicopiae TaxID=2724896 RepID=UPI003BB159BD